MAEEILTEEELNRAVHRIFKLSQTDPEFREDVDDDFDQVQRQHSLDAFQKNVAPEKSMGCPGVDV